MGPGFPSSPHYRADPESRTKRELQLWVYRAGPFPNRSEGMTLRINKGECLKTDRNNDPFFAYSRTGRSRDGRLSGDKYSDGLAGSRRNFRWWKRLLQFCSCSYLGLSNHPVLKTAAKDAIDNYGVGTTSSGIISGYTDVHYEVEKAIAKFMKSEWAIFFNSVTLTSQGIITTVIKPPLATLFPGINSGSDSTAVFSDMENHASLFDAVKLARPDKTNFYHHCDANHLEDLLKRSTAKRKLIVTDGYFSMAADLAPLPEIIDLAEKYGALLMVDDAHGSGVLGENGRGSAELLDVEDKIHFFVGSFSKGFGVRGGFTIGDETFIKYLRVSSRGYMFSATLPPSIPAAAIKALEMAEKGALETRASAQKCRFHQRSAQGERL